MYRNCIFTTFVAVQENTYINFENPGMPNRKEIENFEDIQIMVNDFYGKVRKDELLGPIFDERIQDRWPEHLDKMYRFWQTVLLDEHTYKGAPFLPHATLDVEEIHFERWVSYFNETVDHFYYGDLAEEAKWRGAKMAGIFLMKMKQF